MTGKKKDEHEEAAALAFEDEATAEAAEAEAAAEAGDEAEAEPEGGTIAEAAELLGPLEGQASPDELLEKIADADSVEIQFLDPNGEPLEDADRYLTGVDDWRVEAGKLKPTLESLPFYAPPPGAGIVVLGGYALLLDGEAVARAGREPMSMGGGTQYELKDDVAFG